MRIGLMEMKRFSQEFFEGIKDDTFLAEVGFEDFLIGYR